MRQILLPPDFEAWRTAARDALQHGWLPQQIDLADETVDQPLTLALLLEQPAGPAISAPHAPAFFLRQARIAAVHRDPSRWNLLYRLLHRLQSERSLMQMEVDNDVAHLRRLVDQVHRDVHKMHAFVRFRTITVEGADGPQEHYIAWYQPDHRIVPLVAPFFAERFSIMQWTILTPDASVRWDPVAKAFAFGAGTGQENAPQDDAVEDLWRSYYASIFNPARINPKAMRSEMPVRYWKNLPEVSLLPELMRKADTRVATMMTDQKNKPTAALFVPAKHELPLLQTALPSCRGCDLYKHATQVVRGQGDPHARLMLVGEQPGDQEDLQGLPFVGPAGRVLREVLEDLRIAPEALYMTNAVKHFKFVQRGKLRLHQNPRLSEITACRPWLLAEIDAVQPHVVLCLGASASKSLLGGTFALMQSRGRVVETPYAQKVVATVHPSAVLRARDQQGRDQLHGFLRDDLALAHKLALQ